MITKTCKEIIENAKYIGGIRNSNIVDFYTATLLLNNEYREIYNKVSSTNNAWVKEIEVSGNVQEIPIPEDCYKIIGVYYKSLGNNMLYQINRSSIKSRIPGEYIIENNTIKFIGRFYASQPIVVKYSTMPITLTAPDDMLKLNIPSTATIGEYEPENYVYFQDGGNSYKLDLTTNTFTEEEFKPLIIDSTFLDGALTFTDNKMIYTVNGEQNDVTDFFTIPNKTIQSIVVSDPYVMVNYSDNSIYIYSGLEGQALWNQNAIKNKKTLGIIIAFISNDKTGKGCIYKDAKGNFYEASFTPDTILSYPTNIFFTYLEYKIAAILCGLCGYDNKYLNETLLPNAETTFYESLSQDNNAPYRINNVNAVNRLFT